MRHLLACCFLACAAYAAQAAARVSISAGDELPLVKPSEAVARLRANIVSDASEGTIAFEVKNVLGGTAKTVRSLVFADGRASVPVLDSPLKKGAYDIVWTCTVGSETTNGTQRIAVCDDLGPSQGLNGEFLFGTHAHLQCCRNRHEEELEVRAAARAGFKAMRIDLAWRTMEGRPGAYDWSVGEWRVGLLEKYGINKPIWPNETSEDAMRGEAAQAACYMQKALFSWSRGCCAHNWYKVRDAGRDLSATRRYYGLLSRDFEPLAAYPAVVGTVSLYREAHFEREIPDEDMELLLFSKKKNLILAGWPHKPGGAVSPRPVRIRTDAHEAVFVDLMGNEQPVLPVDGRVSFDVGRYIGSLVLCGATKAEAIANPPLPKPEQIRIRVPNGDYPVLPQLVLDKPENYTSLAGFNPATEHLMWRGPDDLSARYWFKREGDTLSIRAEVTDDVIRFSKTEAPHAGDVMAMTFIVDGRRHFTWVTSVDGHAYAKSYSLSELGFAQGKRILFNTHIWDNDDGIVTEGYIGISPDRNGESTDEWAELTF